MVQARRRSPQNTGAASAPAASVTTHPGVTTTTPPPATPMTATMDLELQKLELERQKLELERQKLVQEERLKAKELDLQDVTVKLKQKEMAWGQWNGPLAVALGAGILGIIGSFVAIELNRQLEKDKAEKTLELERVIQEGTLIMESIKTNTTGEEREAQVAANLYFLGENGLIHLDPNQLAVLKSKRGHLTIPSISTSSSECRQFRTSVCW